MREEIQEANLALLIGLKRHLDDAYRLRQQLDRLIKLASQKPTNDNRNNSVPRKRDRR